VVNAQTKVVLDKGKPISKQLTKDNCTYVINNVITLDGNISIPDKDDVKIGLNVYKKKPMAV